MGSFLALLSLPIDGQRTVYSKNPSLLPDGGFFLKIWCGGSGRRQIRLAGQVTVRYDKSRTSPGETTNHLQLPRPFSAAQQLEHLLVRGTPLEVFLLLPPSVCRIFWLHQNTPPY
ncbi:hypothetical protein BJX64DRAFT_47768 [Aspergillus heterothallicus]